VKQVFVYDGADLEDWNTAVRPHQVFDFESAFFASRLHGNDQTIYSICYGKRQDQSLVRNYYLVNICYAGHSIYGQLAIDAFVVEWHRG